MIATAHAIIDGPDVLRHVRSEPPLTLRHVIGADRATCALCLVGSAAGPLSGDELHLRLEVGDDASASLVASAATIVQGRDGAVTRL